MRNLDITTLRSFLTVAEQGSVTQAAGLLSLTQSAVSMQIKRLEELLGLALFDRAGRRLELTTSGEQMLGYARRMVALNDEAVGRLTHEHYEGEIRFGAPHDVVFPVIPQAMAQMARDFPRVQLKMTSRFTTGLHELYAQGALDMIVTTETELKGPGETLTQMPLVWHGAPGGTAHRQRPLRLAYSRNCVFRPQVIAVLEAHGIPWEMAVDADNDASVMAIASADLAVLALLAGEDTKGLEELPADSGLPDLPEQGVNLYRRAGLGEAAEHFAALLRQGYKQVSQGARAPSLAMVRSARG